MPLISFLLSGLRCRGWARWVRCLPLLALLLGAGEARALCVGACSCNVSAPPLSFGSINPLSSSPTEATTSVRVACGGIASLAVSLRVDLSVGGGSGYTGRRMSNGSGGNLAYNVYTDSAHTQIWGDGLSGTQYALAGILLNILGLADPIYIHAYGQVPGSQTTVKPGTYTDTLSVTLTYF